MSLRVQQDVSLKPFNTLGVEVNARWFAEAHNDADVREALAEAQRLGVPLQVIGGGSNLLLTRDLEVLVLRMLSKGVRALEEQDMAEQKDARSRRYDVVMKGDWW